MIAPIPARVAFTRHAERRALERRLDLRDVAEVAEVVLSHHDQRRRKSRQGRLDRSCRGVAIAYNWPDDGDETTALVISMAGVA